MKGRKSEERAGNKNTERERRIGGRGDVSTLRQVQREIEQKKKKNPKCIWGVAVSSVYASRWWTARWAGQWRDWLWRSGM